MSIQRKELRRDNKGRQAIIITRLEMGFLTVNEKLEGFLEGRLDKNDKTAFVSSGADEDEAALMLDSIE